MGARISKRSGSYNLKKQEEKEQNLVNNKLRRSYSVVSLSEAKIYEDDVVINTTLNKKVVTEEFKELINDDLLSSNKKVSFAEDVFDKKNRSDRKSEESSRASEKLPENEGNDRKESTSESWGDILNGKFWKTSDEPVAQNCEEQMLVEESSEEQSEIERDEQKEVIQEEETETLISDIKIVATNVVNNLKNIEKQLKPICKDYLEVQTNQSKDEAVPKITGEYDKSKLNAIISSNLEEQMEVLQVNNNSNGDSVIDLNLETESAFKTEKLLTSNEINKIKRTKTISGNSDLSFQSIDNSDMESNASDTFYDADDYESHEQLEVWDEKQTQNKLITKEVTNDVIECINEQTKSKIFDPLEPHIGSIRDAQIEVSDKSHLIEENEQEEGSISSLESIESFEKQTNFEIVSNSSFDSQDSIPVTENFKNETIKSVKMKEVDDENVIENEREESSISSLESMQSFEKQSNFEIISNSNFESKNSITVTENFENKTMESVKMEEVDDENIEENEREEGSTSSLESMRSFEKQTNFEIISNSSFDSQNSITLSENFENETMESVKMKEVRENEREEGSMSSLESINGFEKRNNSESSFESMTVTENSKNKTEESVKVEEVDDDPLHKNDIKFHFSEKLTEVENEKNEIEIENHLSIERFSENPLDKSMTETVSSSNTITKITEENIENLNLEQTTAENTNKSINESFLNLSLHESSVITDSNANLLNNSEVKNVPLNVVSVNLENSEEIKLPLNNSINEEVEIIISQINTVIEEINYLKEQIDNITSKMNDEHNISEMYQSLIRLMRNVNAIKYSKFNEQIINLQHVALDKIHYCLKTLQSLEETNN